ncbi:glycosyltransferase family 4 protein [Alteromonas pelagimontana]|uniref:Glycosyltransferase family 4 protein n=1 Tax=Alteromonas pelagimontana TaxID=1858656 RepID=A0A6M4MC52_9ALTE|nr:glycosyltransferase family 4 protein [Alteromonas pelagimontana]QJR80619.1 glycosyltransferase family 4 protein [Alteromonas pelagimontana]
MKMRIMHLEFGRRAHGGAKQVILLINALSEDDFEHILVCQESSELATLTLKNCKTLPIPFGGALDITSVYRVRDIIEEHKPDIVHVHSRRGGDLWGALAAKISGIPAICTRRADDPESLLAKFKYSHFQAVVSVSHGVQEVVKNHCPENISQHIIPFCVQEKEFTHSPNRNWLNKKYNIPAHHQVIASFAQLSPRKGQADIIVSMPDILAENPDITCLLFGRGRQKENYQTLIDRYQLNDHVKLCGFTKHVNRILPNIDVVLHPVYAEGLGVTVLQAAVCKRPIITTPVGGIPDIIEHEKSGLMIMPGDFGQLKDAVLRLLQDKALAEKVGNHAYQHVTRSFTPEAMAKKYASLYQSLFTQETPDVAHVDEDQSKY